MSALLVSVRNAEEAVDAVAGGAGVIDVKEPRRGSLGRADPGVWSRVTACIGTKVPVSVALGELADYRPESPGGGWAGVRFAKWGLAGCRSQPDWPRRWTVAIRSLPPQVSSVGVIYADAEAADSPGAPDIVIQAAQLGCWGVLIDTLGKRSATLFDLMPVQQIADVIESARSHAMAVALAGSLDTRHMEVALSLKPDLIAVRSAVCRGGRNGVVDAEKVRRLAQIISDSAGPDPTTPSRFASNLFGGPKNT